MHVRAPGPRAPAPMTSRHWGAKTTMADLGPKRVAEFIEPFRVTPGKRVRLPHDFDPAGSRAVSVKEAKQILREGVALLSEYQTRLAAQDTNAVVMVLQAMDAAGK